MAELLHSNDIALLAVVEALLTEAEIPYHVADRDMSRMEGSLVFIQPRVLIPDERIAEARQLLLDAELGEWVRP
jgi:hypothetical protein